MIQNLSADEAKKLIEDNKNNRDFIVLDVRTKDEYDAGYIDNAINIDIYLPDFSKKVDELDKNKTYLAYCRAGIRSGTATKMMESMGFKNIYNLIHGFAEWELKRYPITK